MNAAQHDELKRLAAEAPGGLLTAESVVEAARDEASPLHELFEWDDSEAARLFRVQQARQTIRAFVRYEPRTGRKVRGFISLPTDRTNEGGYRPVEAIMANPLWVMQMVDEVRAKVAAMKDSYAYLNVLDPLWPRLNVVMETFITEMNAQRNAG